MTTVELSNAISMIDENILCNILEERYQRTAAGAKTHKPAVLIRRFSLVAAAACLIAVAFTLPLFKNQPNTFPTTPLPTTSSSPNNTLPGGHTPAFSQPTLEKIFTMAPYDKLFPRKILDDYVFYSSYRTEYDPVIGAEGGGYLHVVFTASPDEPLSCTFEVSVRKVTTQRELADISNPQSFDLTYYYEVAKKDELPVKGNYFPTFLPEHISKELLEYRIYVFDDGLCKASVDILFDNYVVSYSYNGYDSSALTAADLYQVIMSSQWFH